MIKDEFWPTQQLKHWPLGMLPWRQGCRGSDAMQSRALFLSLEETCSGCLLFGQESAVLRLGENRRIDCLLQHKLSQLALPTVQNDFCSSMRYDNQRRHRRDEVDHQLTMRTDHRSNSQPLLFLWHFSPFEESMRDMSNVSLKCQTMVKYLEKFLYNGKSHCLTMANNPWS